MRRGIRVGGWTVVRSVGEGPIPRPIPSPLAVDRWELGSVEVYVAATMADTLTYRPTGTETVAATGWADTLTYSPTGTETIPTTGWMGASLYPTLGSTATSKPSYVSTTVLNLHPTFYWPLGESQGGVAYDWSGADNFALVPGPNVQVGQAGPSATYPAYHWTGASVGDLAAVRVGMTIPGTCTQMAVFQTVSTQGQILQQIGNNSTWGGWQSSAHGHTLWVTTGGYLAYGLYASSGLVKMIQSSGTVNDGHWHLAVAIRDGTGLYLYLDDGVLVASTTTVNASNGQSGTWWWSIGQGNTSSSPYTGAGIFAGAMCQVAIWNKVALTTSQIRGIYTAILG